MKRMLFFVALVGVCSLVSWCPRAQARGGWDDIPTAYCYEADTDQDAYIPTTNTVGCLDGEWVRSSNSDAWDGSTPEPGDGAPGGVMVEELAGEGEDGGDASVLTIEDTGDPRNAGFPDPSNRKVFFWRDTSAELDLARGVTLVARWRLNPEPVSEEFENNGGTLPVPNGSFLHDGGKGQIGFVQATPATGTVQATLCLAITETGYLQFAYPFDIQDCLGSLFPAEQCVEVDPDDWVEIWMTAKENETGGIDLKLYLYGDDEPVVDGTLDLTIPTGTEAGTQASYLVLAQGSTGQEGAIQVDYICASDGVFEPGGINPACPLAPTATAQGKDVVLEWTAGDTVPASLDVMRDGAQIASGVAADPPTYTDTDVPPGAHTYELSFTVPGETCDSLTAEITTCPSSLTATPTPDGVLLSWGGDAEYAGLSLSRDGDEIAGDIAGDAKEYLDATAPPGTSTYSLSPTNGTCDPIETTVMYFAVPPGGGDFNGVAAAWDYELDPPADAAEEDYLQHNPNANELGDLDGNWTSGNGSDSWDGSAPGVEGDPLMDPLSDSPGGIGLVDDGDVGAYILEDTGNPTDAGWQDPSNRKLYMAYDVTQAVDDATTRSMIFDGVTLRARLRLTSADSAVDVPDAPNGYQLHNQGKGMVVFNSSDVATGLAQRIGLALDVNPDVPGTGLLSFVEMQGTVDAPQSTPISIAVPDPTQWLDIWVTVEDADGDPITPELSLKMYFNGSTEPAVDLEDFRANEAGPENGLSSNLLTIGMGSTDQDGSYELDLVCVRDGVLPPEGGPPQTVFHRGDPNDDSVMNITDGIYVLNFLFLGGPNPTCDESADANDDGVINITDGIFILNFLFLGGPAPAAPGAPASPCGPDPADSPADLGCALYTSC